MTGSRQIISPRNVLPAIAFLVIASMAFTLWGKPSFRGAVIEPVTTAADFSGYDNNGNEFRMDSQRGRVVVLYFGYLNCPDECPLTLAHVKDAFEILGPLAQDVQLVMVSTDPIRDTPQAMDEYLRRFDPAFLGLTGSLDDMTAIYDAYHVVVLEGGATHSSFTYVIDRNGMLRLTFLPDTPAEDIAHDVKLILAGK